MNYPLLLKSSGAWFERPFEQWIGRILNPKTARRQIIGDIAMGIGMALLEEAVSDRTGRIVTTSLAEYVVAANADVRDVDVLFVGQPDSMTPLGTKGSRSSRS